MGVKILASVDPAGLRDDQGRVVAACDVGDGLTERGFLRPLGRAVALELDHLDYGDAVLFGVVGADLDL